MAVVIVADYTSASFNCYLTIDEAEEIVSSRLYADAYASAQPEKKRIALIEASRLLDTLGWKGSKLVAEQPMMFPRAGMYDLDGVEVTTPVPTWLKRAVVEVAINILSADPNVKQFSKLTLEGLSVSRTASANTRSWYTPTLKTLIGQYTKSSFQCSVSRVG